MHITVILLSETSMIFNVNSFDTIKSLKQKIYEKINFDVVNQSLVFANVELNDDNIFSDYNIIDGCIIKSQMSVKYQKELFNKQMPSPLVDLFDNKNKYQTNPSNGWFGYPQEQKRGAEPMPPCIPYKEPGMGHTPF